MSYLKTWKFNVRNPIRSSQFKRDVKIAKKRGKDMNKLKALLILLIEENRFPLNHPLKGRWMGYRTHTSNRIGC
ncbi:MAG: type II toxin-antitoxin system mRNA interferase toxin, RelE/StbE family [Sulfuricellaceae bacterium]